MPCDGTIPQGMTAEDREAEVRAAVRRLEEALASGGVQVVVGANGAVAFRGWGAADRAGVSDVCAFRRLTQAGSWPLRIALARAEGAAGRHHDRDQIAAGTHSHDGGATWNHGH